MGGVQLDSLSGILQGWIVIISVKGGGLGGCDSVESSSTEWAPEWESERLIKSGEADPECGCGAEVQFGRGGRPASASEKEEAAMALKGTEAKLVSVRTVQQDRSFCVAAEDSEEKEQELNSVWDSKSTVGVLAGWMTSTSSGSEYRGQNGSSTCRNTRVILLHTRYGRQTQTPIQRTRTSRKPREEKTGNIRLWILLQQDQSRPVISVTCNHTQ